MSREPRPSRSRRPRPARRRTRCSARSSAPSRSPRGCGGRSRPAARRRSSPPAPRRSSARRSGSGSGPSRRSAGPRRLQRVMLHDVRERLRVGARLDRLTRRQLPPVISAGVGGRRDLLRRDLVADLVEAVSRRSRSRRRRTPPGSHLRRSLRMRTTSSSLAPFVGRYLSPPSPGATGAISACAESRCGRMRTCLADDPPPAASVRHPKSNSWTDQARGDRRPEVARSDGRPRCRAATPRAEIPDRERHLPERVAHRHDVVERRAERRRSPFPRPRRTPPRSRSFSPPAWRQSRAPGASRSASAVRGQHAPSIAVPAMPTISPIAR